MKTRVLSGLLMLPFLIVIVFGGKVLLGACFLIGILGVVEFYRAFRRTGARPSYVAALLGALGLYGVHLFSGGNDRYYLLWIFGVVLLSLFPLFQVDRRQPQDAMITLLGIFYVVFFSYHVILVEGFGFNGMLVWLIFLTAFGTDISAYFTGYAIGRHKLCPKISPKKTIEGAVGGVAGSVALCALFSYLFLPDVMIHCLVIGALGGVLSQFGDLTASIFKRKLGIKDYGNLIPGHGGILDRFDSVLFTAPVIYYYLLIVMG